MTGRNVPLKRELIEQSSLFDLLMSHHDLQSCFPQGLNQRTSCVATADFFNTIGQHRPRALQQYRYSMTSPTRVSAACPPPKWKDRLTRRSPRNRMICLDQAAAREAAFFFVPR